MFLTSSSMSFFRPNTSSTTAATDSAIRSAYSDDECDYSASATGSAAAMHESTGPLKPHRAQQLLLQHRFQATSHSSHDHRRPPRHQQQMASSSRTASNGGSSSNHSNGNNDNGDRIESLPLKQHQDQQILLKQQLFKSFIPNHLRQQQQNQQEESQQDDGSDNHPLTYYSSSTHSAPGRMNVNLDASANQRRGRCDSYDSCDSSFGGCSSVMSKESDGRGIGNNNDIPSASSQQQQQKPTSIITNGVRSRSISPIRSNNNNKRIENGNNNSDIKMKFAHEILLVSIAAVIDFLKVSGIPKPSIEQLERNVTMGRYYAVLTRAQEYISCVQTAPPPPVAAADASTKAKTPNMTDGDGSSNDDNDVDSGKTFLIVSAWEALCEYKSIQYNRCCDHLYDLQHEMSLVAAQLSEDDYQHHNNYNNRDNNGGDTNSSLYYHKQVQKMTEMQTKLGEQRTKCLTKLHSVQSWQKEEKQRESLQQQQQKIVEAN